MKGDEFKDPVVCTLDDLPFVVPRGKYNAGFTEKTIKLHGASYNYTINMRNIRNAFWLELPEKEMGYFIIGFDKPLIQGLTNYEYVAIQFRTDEEKVVDMSPRYDELPEIKKEISRHVEGKIGRAHV